MPTVVITGANRGIGLEFAKQYAADGWKTHACCRAPAAADALRKVSGDIYIHALDVSEPHALTRVAEEVKDPVQVVIANAGVGAKEVGAFGAIDYAAWDSVFAVNVRGAVGTAEAFAPHLKRAKGKIAGISSLMGSIGDASGGALCYRSSKSALNMAMKIIAAELAPFGIAAAPFHPGWVQTDMGGAHAPVSVAASVSGLRRLIREMPVTASPRFLDYAGREWPW